MKKIFPQTKNITDENVQNIAQLFPQVITESTDESGNMKKVVDFELLKQHLSDNLVDGSDERYRLDWPGKRASILKANTPINKTLRPDRDSSVNFDETENVYIEGDNFEVLKVLQESYLGRINAIYIDPPYNTGTAMIYNNDFSIGEKEYSKELGAYDEDGVKMFKNTDTDGRIHSNWLSFMYERLIIARDLLSDDGILCLTIDDYEIPRVTMMLDEIFGEDNRLGTICIRNNPAGRSTSKGVSITHEYALFYGKSGESSVSRLPRTKDQIERYGEKDELGRFEKINFRKNGVKKKESPKMFYPIFVSDDYVRVPDVEWNNDEKEWILKEDLKEGETMVLPIDDQGKERRWRWSIERTKESVNELSKRIIKDKVHVYYKSRIPNDGVLPNTWWSKKEYSATAYGTNLIKDMFKELQIFTYPKSIYAVEDSIRVMTSKKDALILDFFAGSGTTAHAVMNLNVEDGGNRKFIIAQLPEKIDDNADGANQGFKNISEISKERIRRAGKKILEENAEKLIERGTPLDIGFRVYKTDSSNIKDVYYNPAELKQDNLLDMVDNIKEDRNSEDLLTQVILDLGLTLDLPIETKTIDNAEVFYVAENSLVACFDTDISDTVLKTIAESEPIRAVFRDSSFKQTEDKINVETIFKSVSPDTKIIVL
jgi:adenine-specific DNA-methyltransferase